MRISISLFGQRPISKSAMSEWITAFCNECDENVIDTIWFPERHGDKADIDHAQPLINMAYMAGTLNRSTLLTPGAGSLVPGLHGIQESFDQICQVSALSLNGVRIALGLGWDKSQFLRHGSDFDRRDYALKQLVKRLRENGLLLQSRSLLRTISGDAAQWGLAGKDALGVYTAAFGKSMAMIASNALEYRRELVNSPYRADSGWVACMTHFFVGASDEIAGENYEKAFRPYLEQHGIRAGIGRQAQSRIVDSSMHRMRNEMGLVGASETIFRRLEDYRKAGVDELVLLFQYGDNLDLELRQLAKLCEVLRNV